ncbi:MAG TPA: ABC transporter permease [Vicinamibacterales bacterium]|nr:ABC transporter permease [Vicinamibacterales bacterium]
MKEALVQTIENLRANKLRSFLTMFGILWGIISVVILSAVGEGFRRGNERVLRELGRNIGIVWGGRTSLQAGGERAGRWIRLTADDARAIAEQSRLVAIATPEIQRGSLSVKSRYNAAAPQVHGIEPSYQDIRTIELEYGRLFNWEDERQARRVAIIGADMTEQLFGRRNSLGEEITINGVRYTVIGKIRKKEQDSNYSGPDNDKVFVPFSAMAKDFPRPDAEPGVVSNIIVAPEPWVVADLPRVLRERTVRIRDIDWPLERDIRAVLARRHGFDPGDREAIWMWDTSISSLMFGRMVDTMRDFFMAVGFITLALGGLGVMNIMLIAVRERTREIGIRKALGATTASILRQFFLEGFLITCVSGALGMGIALGLCALINMFPMPERFVGMILTPVAAAITVGSLILVGIATALYPARRAALLPPVEALRYEM